MEASDDDGDYDGDENEGIFYGNWNTNRSANGYDVEKGWWPNSRGRKRPSFDTIFTKR